MRIAYFDCFSGASGDMILGSLVDVGLSAEALHRELSKLGLPNFDLDVKPVTRAGLSGSQAVITIPESEHHRRLSDILSIIQVSSLSDDVKGRSSAVFRRLAEAEAHVHRVDISEIHFHEVGALDAVIDVVGAVIGLKLLNIDEIHCSSLNVGSGFVKCAHGTLPVPAPATAELVKGKPVYAQGPSGELLTPTAAAILTTLAVNFGALPAMNIKSVGYGAGTAERETPNLLRLFVGERKKGQEGLALEEIAVLECTIDDMNPQIYEYLIETFLSRGARDVFLTPTVMKKSRPGTLLTVLCDPQSAAHFASDIMTETTSIGVRLRIDTRLKADRYLSLVETEYGPIRFKVAARDGTALNVSPEYEDCKRVAREQNLPLKEVMDRVRIAGYDMKIVALRSEEPEKHGGS